MTNTATRDVLTSQQIVIDDINDRLRDYFVLLRDKAKNMHPRYQRLIESAGEITLAGGKRNRPYLCMFIAEAYGSREYTKNLDASLFLELIHVAALIHDDIIDNDALRHGKPNLKGLYESFYSEYKDQADIIHFANSASIIAGDVLISESFNLINRIDVSAQLKQELSELLAESNFRLLGGELLDTEAALYGSDYEDNLIINMNKTAHYSFVLPFKTGALLAGCDDITIANLTAIGIELGVAFQLSDDILGVFGDTEITGKSNGSDISEGKSTLLLQKTFELATSADADYVRENYGATGMTEVSIQKIRKIMEECGAKQAVIDQATNHTNKAINLIGQLNIEAPYREQFTKLAHKTANRNK